MHTITELEAELSRVGSLVLTETGQMEHLYAGLGATLCGRDVDTTRTDAGPFYPCLTCQKADKGGKRVRSQRALRALIRTATA